MNRNRVRFFEEDFCQQHGITNTCMLNVEPYLEATLIFAMFATFLALGSYSVVQGECHYQQLPACHGQPCFASSSTYA
jgi:hypothetical protein